MKEVTVSDRRNISQAAGVAGEILGVDLPHQKGMIGGIIGRARTVAIVNVTTTTVALAPNQNARAPKKGKTKKKRLNCSAYSRLV